MSKPTEQELYAYACGFYDGLAVGVERNEFADRLKDFYKAGFDRGTQEYKDQLFPEE